MSRPPERWITHLLIYLNCKLAYYCLYIIRYTPLFKAVPIHKCKLAMDVEDNVIGREGSRSREIGSWWLVASGWDYRGFAAIGILTTLSPKRGNDSAGGSLPRRERPVGSVSLISRSPDGSLRNQFACHPTGVRDGDGSAAG